MKPRPILIGTAGLAAGAALLVFAWRAEWPGGSPAPGTDRPAADAPAPPSATGDEPAGLLESAARIASMPEGSERDKSLASLLAKWVERDTSSAAAWVESLPAGSLRNAALVIVVERWAARSPAEAIRWLEAQRNLPDDPRLHAILALSATNPSTNDVAHGPVSDEILRHQAMALLARDPMAALEWAQAVETDDMRLQNELFYTAFARVVEQDATIAGDWLTKLPAGQGRDEATRILVDGMIQADPAAAFSLARSIEDAEAQATQMSRVLRHWLTVDESAARAGLRQAMGQATTRGDFAKVRHLGEMLQAAERHKSSLRYRP
jgi:hypothetical protein